MILKKIKSYLGSTEEPQDTEQPENHVEHIILQTLTEEEDTKSSAFSN